VDWDLFDIIGIDHYRDARVKDSYTQRLAPLLRLGKPVVVTEFGMRTFQGADSSGVLGFGVVDNTSLRQESEMTMATMKSGRAGSGEADLYFERRGDGPPLLLITGGGGDAGYYSALADILADEYTVLTYDRRGNSRSRLPRGPVTITISGQSTDAMAVLRENGFPRAHIFGNSGGATIALDLAAYHPEAVETVIAHEPPVPRVLPDPGDILAFYEEFDRVLATEGWQRAFTLFQARIGQIPPGQHPAWDYLLRPAKVIPSGPQLDLMRRVSGNWEYMTRYEVRAFIDYVPGLDKIVANHVRIALARGAQTPDVAEIQMTEAVAERLGAECAVFPGGHTAAYEIPTAFAARLRQLLDRLRA
jgi:acetyltransferase/esterase